MVQPLRELDELPCPENINQFQISMQVAIYLVKALKSTHETFFVVGLCNHSGFV